MKELTEEQSKRQMRIWNDLKEKEKAYTQLPDKQKGRLTQINELLTELDDWRAEVLAEQEAYFQSMPQSWRESPAGHAFHEWMEDYRCEVELLDEEHLGPLTPNFIDNTVAQYQVEVYDIP